MSLANDKGSIPIRYITSNALLNDRVRSAGFTNVISVDQYAFDSGNKATKVVFVGEEAPGTDYDAVAKVADEFLQIIFAAVGGVVAKYVRWVRTSRGWEALASTGGQIGVKKTVFDGVDTAPVLTAAQVYGGIVVGTPQAGRAYTLPTAADLFALIPGAGIGTSIKLTIKNLVAAANAITVTASASMTNGGVAGDFTVAAATSATFDIVFASSTAAVLYRN